MQEALDGRCLLCAPGVGEWPGLAGARFPLVQSFKVEMTPAPPQHSLYLQTQHHSGAWR